MRVRARRRHGAVRAHDYECLDGPHSGLTWTILCSFRPSEHEHRAWTQETLADIATPGAGVLEA